MSTTIIVLVVVALAAIAVVSYLALRGGPAGAAASESPAAEELAATVATTTPEAKSTVFSGMRVVAANPVGPLAGSCFSIGPEGAAIGRDGSKCQIVYDNEKVSREHARLHYGPNGLVLTSISKTNMTYLNDNAIQEAIVRPGDRIRISDLTLVVQMEG
jgi:pSer/pThr/pTyr-binding forkhead associated (FHA) protein